MTAPKCGHSILRPDCKACKALLETWYAKLAKDPEWRDIEYGLDSPQLIYQPVELDKISALTTAYYDRVWTVYHDWIKAGRSRRDCMVAELLAKQDGDTGTERGISDFLKSKRMKPNSKTSVHQTIIEINCIALKKIDQPHPSVEQAPIALRPMESTPKKEETNGQTSPEQAVHSRAA